MNITPVTPNSLDHAFVLLFALAFPAYGYISYRNNKSRLLSGEIARQSEYIRTIACQWGLFLIGITLWQSQSRDWAALGIETQIIWQFFIALALAALGVWFFLLQLAGVRRRDKKVLDQLAPEFDSLRAFMPHSSIELRTFYGLSITAGVVEEVLWRGYLIWYLSQYMPVWAAAIVSATLFGAAHAYQGIVDVPKFFIVGLVFSGLYLLSGTLLLPIVLHAAMDMIQGRTAFDYLRSKNSAGAAAV